MRIVSGTVKRMHVIHLNNGDDILLSLRAAVQQKGIRHAIILGAIGSVTEYHFHVVASCEVPPEELYPKRKGAYDIADMTGFILMGASIATSSSPMTRSPLAVTWKRAAKCSPSTSSRLPRSTKWI